MRRPFVILAAVLSPAWLVAGAMAATAGARGHDLQDVRTVTARFHGIAQAEKAGYTPFADCFDSAIGGMGQHYVNNDLLDDGGAVDAENPEALVYEVVDGQLKLVAVEYIVNQVDVAEPPVLFEHEHFHEFGPFYVLHAWVWKDNATGMFMDWNPDVRDCP